MSLVPTKADFQASSEVSCLGHWYEVELCWIHFLFAAALYVSNSEHQASKGYLEMSREYFGLSQVVIGGGVEPVLWNSP